MLYLITIFLLIFLSISNSLFMYFLDFCFENGNILDFYYNFIEKKWSEKHPKIFKILGGCIICLSFWISLIFFHIFYIVLPLQYIFIIPYISITQFIVMKLFHR
jgi:hypothetical protein